VRKATRIPTICETRCTKTGSTRISLDGERQDINAETPKVILVGAHWCSFCQAEFPKVQQWIGENGLPDDVELVAISTAVDETQPNYSPSAWLEREGWSSPVIADDDSGTAARALGVSGFPFFVFVDDDGKVESRWAGALPIDEFASKLTRLSQGT
jgi:cytochrome c biogenesis protein CcmG, thiol:disulfide interchange protein DsbE